MVKSCTPQFVAFEKKFLTTEAFSLKKMTSFYFFKWLVCMCLFFKKQRGNYWFGMALPSMGARKHTEEE